MNRAQRRRLKLKGGKTPTYNYTHEQLEKAVMSELLPLMEAQKEDVAVDLYARLAYIPLIALKETYWQKAPKKKFAELSRRMMEIFEGIGDGSVDIEDLKEQCRVECGVTFEVKED